MIEKAMYHLLYRYLEDCKTLSTSVWLQPCTLLSQTLNLFASPLIIINLVVAYFLIWNKGLDTVNHSLAITKLKAIMELEAMWINGLNQLYLSHREQFLIVSGHDSVSLPALTYGVPQGSILRLVLCLL